MIDGDEIAEAADNVPDFDDFPSCFYSFGSSHIGAAVVGGKGRFLLAQEAHETIFQSGRDGRYCQAGQGEVLQAGLGRQTETDGPAFGNGIGYGFRFVDEGSLYEPRWDIFRRPDDITAALGIVAERVRCALGQDMPFMQDVYVVAVFGFFQVGRCDQDGQGPRCRQGVEDLPQFPPR